MMDKTKKNLLLLGIFTLLSCSAWASLTDVERAVVGGVKKQKKTCSSGCKRMKRVRRYSDRGYSVQDRIKSRIRYLMQLLDKKTDVAVVDYLNKKLAEFPRLIDIFNKSDDLLLELFNKIVIYNHTKTLQWLAEHGIDFNRCGREGTILHMAALEANHAMLTLLCCLSGVNIDAYDNDGDTALHIVASFDDNEGVRILLEYEADVTLCNKEGLQALNKAKDASVRKMLYDALCDQEVAKIIGVFGEYRAGCIKNVIQLKRCNHGTECGAK